MTVFPADEISHVADAIGDTKGLVLFIGAGVNQGIVPLWNEFLESLWEDAVKIGLSPADRTEATDRIAHWVYRSGIFSAYEKASLVKILLGPDRYYLALRQTLYEKSKGTRSPLLNSIAGLCRSQWVKSVLTFNYDEYLEMALDGDPRIPVRHVHGIVKDRSHTAGGAADVVLSMDEYFHNMAAPFSWQTTVQLHALTNSTCLFVGTSLTDINMLRLLTYAGRNTRAGRVFALLAKKEFQDKVDGELKRQPAQGKDLGNMRKDDWMEETVAFVARSKVTLLGDLGVSVIFVDQFRLLPDWIDALTLELSHRKETHP